MTTSILVAGGAGYIGSHVCKALAQAGYVPVTLDNFASGHADFVRFGPLVKACVTDGEAVSNAVQQYGIRAVIDLAGFIEVGESVQDPLKYYQNNASAKLGFLQTLHASGVKAFVFSSTAAVYGEPAQIPIPESHVLLPKNPYGWSKLFLSRFCAISMPPVVLPIWHCGISTPPEHRPMAISAKRMIRSRI